MSKNSFKQHYDDCQNKHQERQSAEWNQHQQEIKKLQKKIIELQDLIIAKDKEFSLVQKESTDYYLKLSDDYSEKSSRVSNLEREILKMKAVIARKWKVPLEETERVLAEEIKELSNF